MKKLFIYISPIFTYFVLAGTSFAQTTYGNCTLAGMSTLRDIISKFVIGCVLVNSVYFVIAGAVVVFLYGIFKFVKSEGDDKQEGRELMFWGIVGLFVMVSIWGLVAILQSTFQISGNYDITPRTININTSRL